MPTWTPTAGSATTSTGNAIAGLDIHQHADGSSHLTGDLTAEATARLRTVLDALTHPRNLDDRYSRYESGVNADPRSGTQRRHDALLAALKLVQSEESTPTAGGVHTTLIITISAEAWRTGAGLARTGHGTLIPAASAARWAGGNPNILAVALDHLGGIAGYSRRQRCFTEQQRLAILARDGCCSFPGCDAPIWYCELDHVEPWADGGTTGVDNGHLVCHSHHGRSRDTGWTPRMIAGRPAWIPPPWLDPDQIPRFNHLRPTEVDTGHIADEGG